LPGTYSLVAVSKDSSIDERIAAEFILNQGADVIVNVLDALQKAISSAKIPKPNYQAKSDYLSEIIKEIESLLPQNKFMATRLLEGDAFIQDKVSKELSAKIPEYNQKIESQLGEDADILIADRRYSYIEKIITTCVDKSQKVQKTFSNKIDNIVLNRFIGIPLFLSAMYLMFFFAINIGGALQDFFDIASGAIFVDGLASVLTNLHFPNWLIAVLAEGAGKGVQTTLTFIPVIGAMFLFLSMLEDSGYMARAAFVVDRLMKSLGLPGKSFVPMIVGFGCNVPSIIGARTLDNKRDRILTIIMSPFMSCGARLAIFAVFVAAFFPINGASMIFALYLTGIVLAMLTGLLLRKTLLKGDPAPLLLELPPYHLPKISKLFLNAWQRLKVFIFKTGKVIVPVCILIGILSGLNIDGNLADGEGDTTSLLAAFGKFLTPIFYPLGITDENWPATVGLITGVLAKEVVVGTLNAIYSNLGHLGAVTALAYGVAVAFYQLATIDSHMLSSITWIMAIAAFFTTTVFIMNLIANKGIRETVNPASNTANPASNTVIPAKAGI